MERSSRFLTEMITGLESHSDYSQFQPLALSYNQSYESTRPEYPNQIAAVVAVRQPDVAGASLLGAVDPESSVLLAKRSSTNRWGANTWATPMGSIENDDVDSANPSLGHVIRTAARRELGEEIARDPTGEHEWIAGSYIDTKTGNVIHVVVQEIGDTKTEGDTISVSLPNDEEHDDTGWVDLKDFPHLSPVEQGTKYLFLTALREMQKANAQSITSGRYK